MTEGPGKVFFIVSFVESIFFLKQCETEIEFFLSTVANAISREVLDERVIYVAFWFLSFTVDAKIRCDLAKFKH